MFNEKRDREREREMKRKKKIKEKDKKKNRQITVLLSKSNMAGPENARKTLLASRQAKHIQAPSEWSQS